MIISKSTLLELLRQLPEAPPEIGGILGGKSGVVCTAAIDTGIDAGRACSYTPDVEKLNKVIAEWQENGIEFAGIFHMHFFGVRSLSKEDVTYIAAIMESMPKCVELLYFPVIVMPAEEVVVYKAQFKDGQLTIVEEKLSIC